MTPRNYGNRETVEIDRAKTLYTIKYEGLQRGTVHMLASGLDEAIKMFCDFYRSRVADIADISDSGGLSEFDRNMGEVAIQSIEKIVDPVMHRVDERKK